MKIFKFLVLALLVLGVGLYSCKKDAHVTVTSDAVIRNSGPLQGCGFLMVIQQNNQTYSPTNLTADFQPTDSLKVRVTYKLLSTFNACTVIAGGYQQIEVQSITKIN